jgi:UDP-N-acetylglucosamine--N-acetylmuramyl-(pentapeptide) pyrophosphoryl-undecaprenol N-acetylglucosamine transferase
VSEPASRTIVFAGGGTAGHVEPALAVARAWKRKYPSDHCIFLGTPAGLENTLVPAAGFELRIINKVVMPRNLSFDIVRLPAQLFQAVKSAKKVIKGAEILIGFGGYLSASAYLAAWSARVPIVVHEANAKLGWANRLGALLTKNLATARPLASGPFARAIVTGLPLRSDVKTAYLEATQDWQEARRRAKKVMGWKVDQPALLVLGGSQGSSFINSQIAAALPALREKNIQILHSVGTNKELPQNFGEYKAVPYITDMAMAYLAADVVLARSGAVTCAEVGALGQMALFVPLPIGNGEQARNADHLVSIGRAIVVSQDDFSSQWLVEQIDEVVEQSRQLPEPEMNPDLEAEERIVLLMEDALRRSSR